MSRDSCILHVAVNETAPRSDTRQTHAQQVHRSCETVVFCLCTCWHSCATISPTARNIHHTVPVLCKPKAPHAHTPSHPPAESLGRRGMKARNDVWGDTPSVAVVSEPRDHTEAYTITAVAILFVTVWVLLLLCLRDSRRRSVPPVGRESPIHAGVYVFVCRVLCV